MDLEITVVQEIELQGLVEVAEGWVQEWRIARERGLDNTLRLLSNMYDDYKQIKSGKNPRINTSHIDTMGEALKQLKEAVAQDRGLSKYRFLFPALDTAYAELVIYASQPQKATPVQASKKSA